jgi:CO dehydrogenase/acetyl-CoA synthase beta subunit
MHLFDELFCELMAMLEPYKGKCMVDKSDTVSEGLWKNAEKQVILKSESKVELGGGGLPAVSLVLYTEDCQDKKICRDSDVALYGRNLDELKGDVPYARVSIVDISPDFLKEEFKLYQLLRSIEYIRYHISPEGYMPRISTAHGREQIRVSKSALENHIDFFKVGHVYNAAYKKHPAVSRVRTIFITLEDFDYAGLNSLSRRAEEIIMSLDHPLNNLNMDCNSCKLKPVCDEADSMCTK